MKGLSVYVLGIILAIFCVGCQGNVSEDQGVVNQSYSLYAMMTTDIPKPSESVVTTYDLASYNSLLELIEGDGWQVKDDGIKRLTPIKDLHFIVDKAKLVTDEHGTAEGELNSINIDKARLILHDVEIPKSSYEVLIDDDNNIYINSKLHIEDISCSHEDLLDQSRRGGDWDGSSQGRACLDDNGTGPANFLGSDCDQAFTSDLCAIDYLFPDHNCYHHHNGRTCSVAIGHSQTWHTHSNETLNAVASVIKKIFWPW